MFRIIHRKRTVGVDIWRGYVPHYIPEGGYVLHYIPEGGYVLHYIPEGGYVLHYIPEGGYVLHYIRYIYLKGDFSGQSIFYFIYLINLIGQK